MKHTLLMVVIVVLLLSGCARASRTAPSPEGEAIARALLEAMSTRDIDALLGLLAEDIVFRQEPPKIRVEGKGQVEAVLRQGALWNHRHSIASPPTVDGDKVRYSAEVTGEDLRIMGMESMSAEYEFHVRDGKINLWITRPKAKDWKRITELTAGGVGIRYDTGDQGPRIREFPEDSPARAAGVRVGDTVVAVDGVPYSQMRSSEWQLRMRGPVGTRVRLTVAREGSNAPIDIEVERADFGTLWR